MIPSYRPDPGQVEAAIPSFMREKRQFVLRAGKRPLARSPGGLWGSEDWNNPAKWGSLEEALQALSGGRVRGADGLGWVCKRASDGEPQIVFIDLDSVRDPKTGWVHPEADKFLKALKSPFVEVSMSGCGFHAVVQCKRPPFEKNIERFDLSDELPEDVRQHIYSEKRGEKADLRPESIKPAIEVFQSGKHVALTFSLAKEYCNGAGRDDWSDVLKEFLRPYTAEEVIEKRGAQQLLEKAISRAVPGTRNDTGLWLACQLRDLGLSCEEAAEWMLKYQRAVEKLGGEAYTKKEALATVKSAYSREPRGPPGPKRIPAAMWMLHIAMSELELWNDGSETTYASMKLPNGGVASYPIESTYIRSWLVRQYLRKFDKAPPKQALTECMESLVAEALDEEAPVYRPHLRLGKHEGKIYVDLGRKDWQILEISAEGWQIIEKAPIRFVRYNSLGELPIPQEGGSWGELRKRLRAKMDDDDFVLVVAWMLQAVWPDGPYTHLIVDGEQGSGKTVLSKALKMILDPSDAMLRRPPRTEGELYLIARREPIIGIDNSSGIPEELSDAFCALSTGGTFGKRQLYKDFEEVKTSPRRPCIINGIEVMPYRPDLLDRIIHIRLRALNESEIVTEEEILADIKEYAPKVWGLLVKAASAGLRNKERAREALSGKLPRMADFSVWITACEETLPWPPGTLLDVYRGNRKGSIIEEAEGDRFTMAVYRLAQYHTLKGDAYVGSATQLYDDLCRFAGINPNHPPRDWPQNPRALGKRLTRVSPALKHMRAVVDRKHSDSGTLYVIFLDSIDSLDISDISSSQMSAKNRYAENPADVSDVSDIFLPFWSGKREGDIEGKGNRNTNLDVDRKKCQKHQVEPKHSDFSADICDDEMSETSAQEPTLDAVDSVDSGTDAEVKVSDPGAVERDGAGGSAGGGDGAGGGGGSGDTGLDAGAATPRASTEPPDVMAVASELHRRGEIDKVGLRIIEELRKAGDHGRVAWEFCMTGDIPPDSALALLKKLQALGLVANRGRDPREPFDGDHWVLKRYR